MTEDKKTVHLVIWIAFGLSVMNFLLYVFGIVVLLYAVKDLDPTVIVALLAAGAGNLSSAGFLALLARTRSDPQPVTVENTIANPVPTEPQAPIEALPGDEPTDEIPVATRRTGEGA